MQLEKIVLNDSPHWYGPMFVKLAVAMACMFGFGELAHGADVKDADAIQGTWLAEEAELSGKKMADAVRKPIKLVLKEDTYTLGVDKGTVKLNASAKPKEIDVVGLDGPNKGKTILAIYELDGDTLRICYDLSGKSRPTEFKTKADSKLFLVTYKREKK